MERDMEGEGGGGELERELLIPDWIKCRILYLNSVHMDTSVVATHMRGDMYMNTSV